MPLVAAAQVDERLAAYTGRNAKGYLSPLVDSFRSGLNSWLFHSAQIPVQKFYVSFEVNAMATFFDKDSRWFTSTTEGNFLPEQTAKAPTIVGDDHAVFVDGTAGTHYTFPGSFETATSTTRVRRSASGHGAAPRRWVVSSTGHQRRSWAS
jgi:transposase